jgi:hypothetical protein
MNVAISCDITPCSSYVNRRFGGTFYLHLQCRKSVEQRTSLQQMARHNSIGSHTQYTVLYHSMCWSSRESKPFHPPTELDTLRLIMHAMPRNVILESSQEGDTSCRIMEEFILGLSPLRDWTSKLQRTFYSCWREVVTPQNKRKLRLATSRRYCYICSTLSRKKWRNSWDTMLQTRTSWVRDPIKWIYPETEMNGRRRKIKFWGVDKLTAI